MSTEILEFCKVYEEKLRLDKDIAETEIDFLQDYRDRISFEVGVHRRNFNMRNLFHVRGVRKTITLDAEDLKHLYEKYSKKLQDELLTNIAKIKKEYESTSHLEGS